MNIDNKIENDHQLRITKNAIAEFESALEQVSDKNKTIGIGEDTFLIKFYQDSFQSVIETLKSQVNEYEIRNKL